MTKMYQVWINWTQSVRQKAMSNFSVRGTPLSTSWLANRMQASCLLFVFVEGPSRYSDAIQPGSVTFCLHSALGCRQKSEEFVYKTSTQVWRTWICLQAINVFVIVERFSLFFQGRGNFVLYKGEFLVGESST